MTLTQPPRKCRARPNRSAIREPHVLPARVASSRARGNAFADPLMPDVSGDRAQAEAKLLARVGRVSGTRACHPIASRAKVDMFKPHSETTPHPNVTRSTTPGESRLEAPDAFEPCANGAVARQARLVIDE